MTQAEKRGVLRAIAGWEASKYAMYMVKDEDRRAELRDEIAMAIAPILRLDVEDAMNQMQAMRMSA